MSAAATIGPDWRDRNTLTVEQVAPVLGIGRSAAYEGVRSGDIPSIRIGGRILIPVAALRRLLGEMPLNESNPPLATTGPMKTTGAGGRNEERYSE
jgi:excisionase family DNA binding protein